MKLAKAKLKNRLLRLRLRGRRLPPLARHNLQALDHLDPQRPAREYSFVVVDLETTGLDLQKDRVVSVGALRLAQGRVRLGEMFSELVNPGRSIPAESIKIHGIKPDQVAGARKASQVFEDFLAFLGNDILVAHYAGFDLHFINFTMKRLYGFPLQNLVLDTVRMCRNLLLPSDPYGVAEHTRRCNLDALCERFAIQVPERHTSLGDALATALVFQRLLAHLEKKGSGTLGELLRAAALD